MKAQMMLQCPSVVDFRTNMLDAVPSGCSKWQNGGSTFTIDENNNWVEWVEFVCTVDPALASAVFLSHHLTSSVHIIPFFFRTSSVLQGACLFILKILS